MAERETDDPRPVFAAALARLRRRLPDVSDETLARRASAVVLPSGRRVAVNARRLGEWINGQSVPRRFEAVMALVETVERPAAGSPADRPTVAQWQRLWRAARDQRSSPAPEQPAPAPERPQPRPQIVIGRPPGDAAALRRHDELTESIDAGMRNGSVRQILLTGAGGVGKSQLASAAFHRAKEGTGVLLWVPAGNRPSVLNSYARAWRALSGASVARRRPPCTAVPKCCWRTPATGSGTAAVCIPAPPVRAAPDRSGRPSAARDMARGLADRARRRLGDSHRDVLTLRAQAAQADGELGDAAAALRSLAEVRREAERGLGRADPDTLSIRLHESRFRMESGLIDAALADFVALAAEAREALAAGDPRPEGASAVPLTRPNVWPGRGRRHSPFPPLRASDQVRSGSADPRCGPVRDCALLQRRARPLPGQGRHRFAPHGPLRPSRHLSPARGTNRLTRAPSSGIPDSGRRPATDWRDRGLRCGRARKGCPEDLPRMRPRASCDPTSLHWG